ncbi:unnamed protein product [Oppiella nova]|uniref:FAM69 protein-kinase domain-containing protein n=1 Tax=Oppiella nova TaxID=334625 RepID=A0A7R9M8P1_9ACAR|nr:unnamed protein product [Oppiella nova]CAG2171725.1 unnamed protein product [Oppiella nova]
MTSGVHSVSGGHRHPLRRDSISTNANYGSNLQVLDTTLDGLPGLKDQPSVVVATHGKVGQHLSCARYYARLIDKTEADLQVLKIRGVCGRLVAFDGNYQTLDAFIKDQKGFEVMAGIGVQIIQLVDDLQDSDADWYYLATDLTADSFAVNSEGEVFLSDLNRVLVIDKSVFTGADKRTARSRQSLLDSRVCNEPCFQTFHNRFKQAFNTTSSLPSLECQRVDVYYGQRMYAMICRNIFSAVESSAGAADDVNGSQTTARPIVI